MSEQFHREVKFRPGYNYLHETGPNRRGQHGMDILFLLYGSEGVTQFVMTTSWTPRGLVDEDKTYENGYSPEPVHCDLWETSDVPFIAGTKFGHVRPPSGMDVGYHWKVPLYEDHYSRDDCSYLPGETCYYDGSGLAADELLKQFIETGESVVWQRLEEWYRDCQEKARG